MHMLRYVGGKEGIDDGPRGVVRLLSPYTRVVSPKTKGLILVTFCMVRHQGSGCTNVVFFFTLRKLAYQPVLMHGLIRININKVYS